MSSRQAEAGAIILRYWSPIVVPGVAQTPGYMRALFEDEGHLLDQIDELVTARLERQSVIGRVPVTMIIGQHVLSRLVGSPAVMTEQCGYLASVAERSGVALHVLPDGVNMGVWGACDIAATAAVSASKLPTAMTACSCATRRIALVPCSGSAPAHGSCSRPR